MITPSSSSTIQFLSSISCYGALRNEAKSGRTVEIFRLPHQHEPLGFVGSDNLAAPGRYFRGICRGLTCSQTHDVHLDFVTYYDPSTSRWVPDSMGIMTITIPIQPSTLMMRMIASDRHLDIRGRLGSAVKIFLEEAPEMPLLEPNPSFLNAA